MKPFKLTLKLRDDASPHLTVSKLKVLIKKDKTLSPLLKKNLLLMRKTKMPYILLASKKEIIYVGDEHYHLDRGIEPNLTGWFRIDWSAEEIEDYEADKKEYIKESLHLFDALGYDLYNRENITKQDINKILAIIKTK